MTRFVWFVNLKLLVFENKPGNNPENSSSVIIKKNVQN